MPNISHSVNREQATKIAREIIQQLDPRHDFVIEEDKTLERNFGWVFFYSPRQYILTHDRNYLVPGNGPLVVYRATGKQEFLSTSLPPEKAIEVLEKHLQ